MQRFPRLVTALVLLPLVAACSGATAEPPPSAAASQPPGSPAAGDAPADAGPPADGAPVGSSTPKSALYFPPKAGSGDWETITPALAGFDAARLDATVDFVEQTGASTFLVASGGRIVVEKYWGATEDTVRDVASAQKSLVSMLVGIAAGKGLFGLDDEVGAILGAGWSNDTPENEAGITVRHLLTMTSGLDASLKRAAAPGSAWLYNTDAYHRLELVLETKAGKTLQELTRAWLLDPIGAGPSAWTKRAFQKDAKGVPVSALEMTARDMARAGLLVMAGGEWNGGQAVPTSYLGAALGTSQAQNPSYGLLWWLNGKASHRLPPSTPKDGMLMPSAPADLVAALGAGDQKIYVARAAGLVVIRQGKAAANGSQALSGFDDELWKRIMSARTP